MRKILLIFCVLMLFLTSCLDENGNMQVFDSNGNLVPMTQIETIQRSIDEQATTHPEKPYYIDTYRPDTDGLVLYLPFYLDTFGYNNNTFRSYDTYGANCTFQGSCTKTDYGRHFDKIDDKAVITGGTWYMPDTWTIIFWLRNSASVNQTIMTWNAGTNCSIAVNWYNTNKPIVVMNANNYKYFSQSTWTTISDGNWHCVAWTMPGAAIDDISNCLMYLDGIVDNGETAKKTSPQYTKNKLIIGGDNSAPLFGGDIASFWMYNRVLSETELEDIYDKTKWRYQQ